MIDKSNQSIQKFATRGSKHEIEKENIFCPKFDESGLIPCIVSEYETGIALMFAFMDATALSLTIETGIAHFWSRSRKKLWKKGETSGHIQSVVEILTDCDQDVICLTVKQTGGACHLGYRSCFYRSVPKGPIKDPKNIILEQKDLAKTFDSDEVYKV